MTTPDLPRVEAAIIQETNAFRASEKRAAVAPNAMLTKAARDYATFLAASQKFAHEADGRKPQDRTKAAGYAHCTIAENLASVTDSRGIDGAELVRRMIEGWKASPPHRAAMVHPDVTEIGVGLAQSPRDPQTWIAVQLFGRPDSLRYSFRIENASTSELRYTFNGRAATAPMRAVIEHTACSGGGLRIEGIAEPLQARNGAVFRITGRAGTLELDTK